MTLEKGSRIFLESKLHNLMLFFFFFKKILEDDEGGEREGEREKEREVILDTISFCYHNDRCITAIHIPQITAQSEMTEMETLFLSNSFEPRFQIRIFEKSSP